MYIPVQSLKANLNLIKVLLIFEFVDEIVNEVCPFKGRAVYYYSLCFS